MRFFILFLLLSFNVLAIGVSPSGFEVAAKPGEIIEKDFYLYNTNNVDKNYQLIVEGYDWFSFFPSKLNIKANSKSKVKVILEVPNNVSMGVYVGNILFKEETKDNGLYLVPGVKIPYNITVKGGFFGYSVEERARIYHSAAVFEQNIKEDVRKIEIKPEIVSFGVLFLVIIILLVFVLRRFLKLSKSL